MLTIGDHNYRDYLGDNPVHCGGEKRLCTVKPRDYNARPYGSIGLTTVASKHADGTIPRIPIEEWPDRIADMDRNRSWALDHWEGLGIDPLDQDGVGYCHAFSLASAAMIARGMQGLPYEELSASSIGGPVTGWKNAGAYILDDLEQGMRAGLCSTKFGPMLTTRRADFKPGWEEDARNHKIEEAWEGDPNDWVSFVSCLLTGFVVPGGWNWWGHAVTAVRVVNTRASEFRGAYRASRNLDPVAQQIYLADFFDLDILNSWGNWGKRGIGRLTGSKKYVNEWYVVRRVTNYAVAA
jgi:hypothetical protein